MAGELIAEGRKTHAEAGAWAAERAFEDAKAVLGKALGGYLNAQAGTMCGAGMHVIADAAPTAAEGGPWSTEAWPVARMGSAMDTDGRDGATNGETLRTRGCGTGT